MAEPQPPPPSALSPLRVPGFRRLAGAYTISRFGDMLALVALAIAVYAATDSTLAVMALFLALEFFPALVGPAVTARLDRIAVRRVLPTIYALEAAIFVALAAMTHSFSLAPFLVLVAADAVLGLTARAIARGTLPAVLHEPGSLRAGNALLNMALSPSMAIGGLLGGSAVAGLGTDAALLLNAGSFAFAALLVGTASGLPRYDGPDEEPLEHWRLRLRAAVAYVRGNRPLLVLILGQTAALTFFALTEPIEVAYARDTLAGGDGAYGWLIAAWGAGVMVGSVLYAWLGRERLLLTAVVSTVLQALSYIGLALAGSIGLACAVAAVGGAANGAQLAAVTTAIQEAIAPEFQVRVMSLFEGLSTASPGLGYLAGGAVGTLLGVRPAFIVAGAGVLVVLAVVAAARPWRAARGTVAVPFGAPT